MGIATVQELLLAIKASDAQSPGTVVSSRSPTPSILKNPPKFVLSTVVQSPLQFAKWS